MCDAWYGTISFLGGIAFQLMQVPDFRTLAPLTGTSESESHQLSWALPGFEPGRARVRAPNVTSDDVSDDS